MKRSHVQIGARFGRLTVVGEGRHPKHLFHNYGGRGIVMHPRWRDDYEAFLSDVGRKPSPEHSLDRIDNDGNYEPGNVRWATSKEQNNNRRPKLRRRRDCWVPVDPFVCIPLSLPI